MTSGYTSRKIFNYRLVFYDMEMSLINRIDIKNVFKAIEDLEEDMNEILKVKSILKPS